MKEEIKKKLLEAGAMAVGFAKAGEIDPSVSSSYEDWITNGMNAGMVYLQRHIPWRRNTENVLQGAKTVISLAFSYVPEIWRKPDLPLIACYAYGEDYHEVLRKKLKPVITDFQKKYGGNWRICIDSAPVSERYWAMRAGIGKKGVNGSIIVEGCGSFCFLCEILTSLELKPDSPSDEKCNGCGACMEACPAKALLGNGCMDSRRCLNYLTIEEKLENRTSESINGPNRGVIFGCDICQRVCPHNRDLKPTSIPEFNPINEILNISEDYFLNIEEDKFKSLFSCSPLRRAGLNKLKDNIRRSVNPS